MLDKVSVLLPYKPDNGIRDEIFKWVKKYYENILPEVEICIGVSNSNPFNRSRAINKAAQIATKDIYVIADTDIIYDPNILIQSIKLLEDYAWVIPYLNCLDLTKSSTENLMKKDPQFPFPVKIDYTVRYKNKKYIGVGGLIVVSRENFNKVNGFDERFKGWGREDNAFRNAMNTICGQFKRIESGSIYHLWHPRVGGKGNPNIKNNDKLYEKYKKVNGNKIEMEKLIMEGKS